MCYICINKLFIKPYSLLTLSNNCSIKETFKDMKKNYLKLYKRKVKLLDVYLNSSKVKKKNLYKNLY